MQYFCHFTNEGIGVLIDFNIAYNWVSLNAEFKLFLFLQATSKYASQQMENKLMHLSILFSYLGIKISIGLDWNQTRMYYNYQ